MKEVRGVEIYTYVCTAFIERDGTYICKWEFSTVFIKRDETYTYVRGSLVLHLLLRARLIRMWELNSAVFIKRKRDLYSRN